MLFIISCIIMGIGCLLSLFGLFTDRDDMFEAGLCLIATPVAVYVAWLLLPYWNTYYFVLHRS